MVSFEAIRERLLTPEQAAAMDAPGSKAAAVLIPLFPDADGNPAALLTRRRGDLRQHAGQISFPGGRQDEPDEDLRATALREADEEIGLAPSDVDLLGALAPVGTFVTGYRVHPFVGAVAAGYEWRPQETEVASIIELSLQALIAGFESKRLLRRGVPFATPTYTVGDTFVWGATGRMLEDLLGRLAPLL